MTALNTAEVLAAIAQVNGVERFQHDNNMVSLFGYSATVSVYQHRDGAKINIHYRRRNNNKVVSTIDEAVSHVTRWSKRIKSNIDAHDALVKAREEHEAAEKVAIREQAEAAGLEYLVHFSNHCVRFPATPGAHQVYLRNGVAVIDVRMGEINRSITLEQAKQVIALLMHYSPV